MAALMDIGTLGGLLKDATAAGCRLAWVEDGRLLAGAQVREAAFSIDFAGERLVAVADRRPDGVAHHPDDSRQARLNDPVIARAPSADVVSPPSLSGRRTGNFSLILEGKLHYAKSQRELLRDGLQAIERARPGTLEKLSMEKARTKRPVSRRREGLYEDVKLAKHADQIEGGWWVATNNSFSEVEKYLRRAAYHAGLHLELRRSP